jgi:hypothetical protein
MGSIAQEHPLQRHVPSLPAIINGSGQQVTAALRFARHPKRTRTFHECSGVRGRDGAFRRNLVPFSMPFYREGDRVGSLRHTDDLLEER